MNRLLAALLVGCVVVGGRAFAQPPPPPGEPPGTLRVFIDCPDGCDSTYLRTELNVVDHVRDREVADVHVLITERGTGGGGTEFTVTLIGLKRFASIQETVTYASQPGDTDDAERRGVLRAIKVGLVRYLIQTPLANRIEVTFKPVDEEDEGRRGQTTDDRWNFWVFRVRGNTDTNGEESGTSLRLSGSFAATRVTEQWKSSVNLGLNYRRNRYVFEEEDEPDYVSISRDSAVSGTLIKSMGSHWGGGAKLSMASSTYTNHERLFRLAPAIEYNVFPYAETTRRQLTFRYTVGLLHAKYLEETLYGKLEESLLNHALAANWDMKQPWGTLDVQVEASQYLPELSKYRISLEGDAEIRLFKGFSLDIGAGTSRIRDQVYLPSGQATQEEVLLRLRQIATAYDYGFSIGFSYSFGSVYNNVVNSRLSGF
jgi:hypothetical protein